MQWSPKKKYAMVYF